MNTDKIARLNPSPIIAACIIAAGLVVAAIINSHKYAQQTSEVANAQSVAAVPSEASIRQQFLSQMNAQYSGRTKIEFGRSQIYNRLEVMEVKTTTKGDESHIVYATYWNGSNGRGGCTTVTGCDLTKDAYGHFTNADDLVSVNAFHPHIDIQ